MSGMKVQFVLTVDRKGLLSRLVRSASGGEFSHCLILFTTAKDEKIYFESINKRCANMGGKDKTGVRGPIPLERLEEWLGESTERRARYLPAYGRYLPFTEDECEYMYKFLCAAARVVSYAHLQIIKNWISLRTGVNLKIASGSHKTWTCSETCMRVVPSRFWRYFDMLNYTADDVVPSGTRLPSIETGVENMMKDKRNDAIWHTIMQLAS